MLFPEGAIRKGSKGLSPQGSAALLTFPPAWLTAHRCRAYTLFFVSFNTHPSLAETSADKAAVFRVRLHAWLHCSTLLYACPKTQVWLFWKSAPAGLQIQPCPLFCVSVPPLISTADREPLRSALTSAGCCLQGVLLPVPPIHWASGSIVPMGTARVSVCISSMNSSGFPTPSCLPPTWLLSLKIAPAALQCVLSPPQLLHSLGRW